jgi:hypothetical protein
MIMNPVDFYACMCDIRFANTKICILLLINGNQKQ